VILNNPDNRAIVKAYLEQLSEDELIEQFIVPIFSRYGFRVYRIVTHGPGEHGKDVIFVRYDPLHLSEEFIAVQAKAQKVTTKNAPDFAKQIDRAQKVGFKRVGGGGTVVPQYVFFMNSRKHTNDAATEFPDLVNDPAHVRIFSQEHLCDLIMVSGVAPKKLLGMLAVGTVVDDQDVNQRIYTVLMADEPAEVDHLLDHELKLVTGEISDRMKEMIIDFASKKWNEDPTWSGLARPMKWLNDYFTFIGEDQYPLLMNVFREYSNSYASRAAASDTREIVGKIRPEHIERFADEFADFAVSVIRNKAPHVADIVAIAKAARDAGVVMPAILDVALAYYDERQKMSKERDADLLQKLREELDAHFGEDD